MMTTTEYKTSASTFIDTLLHEKKLHEIAQAIGKFSYKGKSNKGYQTASKRKAKNKQQRNSRKANR